MLELAILGGIGGSKIETMNYRLAGSGIHKNTDVCCDLINLKQNSYTSGPLEWLLARIY